MSIKVFEEALKQFRSSNPHTRQADYDSCKAEATERITTLYNRLGSMPNRATMRRLVKEQTRMLMREKRAGMRINESRTTERSAL